MLIMKLSRVVSLLAFGTVLAAAAPVAFAAGPCKSLNTAIRSGFDQTDCPSLCTAGVLEGAPGPLRHGTSHFVVYSLDSSGIIWTYTGQFVLSTEEGSLTISSVGTIDFSSEPAIYHETETIIGASGEFTGATGSFESSGTFDGAEFVGTIYGQICLAE
jgi:hypothetical protein